LGNLIKRLDPIADKIKNLSGEGDVGISVDILASEIPGLCIDREALRVMANVGAWLDIDVTISEGPTDSLVKPSLEADDYRVN
jgi:hypothetical protein